MPVGYERRDTVASLSMLLGNVAVNLAAAARIGKLNRVVFNRRIANIGARRGSLAVAIVAWDFLYYWDHRWMHEVRLFWANHVRTTPASATTCRRRCANRGRASCCRGCTCRCRCSASRPIT